MRTREELLLGNCTKRLMEIEYGAVDLVVTDPPYNTGMTARNASRLQNFFHDTYEPEEYGVLARTVAHECYRILKDDRACYVFMNWRSLGVWLDALAAAGFRLKNLIVWDKVVPGLNYQNYAHAHELLIFAAEGRFLPRNKGTGDDQGRDVWRIRRETRHARAEEFHHETMKPEILVRWPIEHASLPGEVVCDPFMGSGTTCAVAKVLGRGYIGTELDPQFFSLAAARVAAVRDPFSADDACRAPQRTPPSARRKPRCSRGIRERIIPMSVRRMRQLSARDLRALAWIGEGYEVAQYQLETAVFPGLSPTVTSRFVRRAVARGFVTVDRLGIGMNRLRLTPAGRDAVVIRGHEAERLFVPRRPVAWKDLRHTLHINDLRVVFATQTRPPTELLPAWRLQRQLTDEVIPDLLAVWRNSKGVSLLLACEVDRGTENLGRVFLPKLRRLAQSLRESAGERAAILVITEGRRRMELLLSAAATFDRLLVERLPEATGARALAEYRERLVGNVSVVASEDIRVSGRGRRGPSAVD